jgi:4-hydroxybenzoate polyprenyltransferase
LGTAFLIQSSIVQLGSSNHLVPYSLLSFFATLFIYNFQRIFYQPKPDISLHSIRRKWIFKNQLIIKTLSFAGFMGVAIVFFHNDFKIIFYLSPLLILSIAYFIPFVRLRKSPWFKLLTLVIVWTVVTAVVPILLSQEAFDAEDILHVIVRFSFMMAICIPFDIRDLEIDKADNISTLPQLLGENKTRQLAVVFMFIYILLIILEYCLNMFGWKIFVALLVSAIINAVLVFSSSSKRSEYFFVAGLDGTMILQGVLLLFAEYL